MKIEILPVKKHEQILDAVLYPMMWIGANFGQDSIQHTHPWHTRKLTDLEVEYINPELNLYIEGSEQVNTLNKRNPLFHLPLLGGWKNYVVIENPLYNEELIIPWHIGWIYNNQAEIHKLPIQSAHIKMLTGPMGHTTTFFAISDGIQIPIASKDTGKLFDKRYRDVRLY